MIVIHTHALLILSCFLDVVASLICILSICCSPDCQSLPGLAKPPSSVARRSPSAVLARSPTGVVRRVRLAAKRFGSWIRRTASVDRHGGAVEGDGLHHGVSSRKAEVHGALLLLVSQRYCPKIDREPVGEGAWVWVPCYFSML